MGYFSSILFQRQVSGFQNPDTQKHASSQPGSKHHPSTSRLHRQTADLPVAKLFAFQAHHLISSSPTPLEEQCDLYLASMSPSRPRYRQTWRIVSTFLPRLPTAQTGTGASLIGATLPRLRHAPTTCKHTVEKARRVTRSSLSFPRAPMGSPGAASVLGPVAAVCFFRGSLACRNSTRPAPSNQTAGDPSAWRPGGINSTTERPGPIAV